jgi:hypothetical protein
MFRKKKARKPPAMILRFAFRGFPEPPAAISPSTAPG